MRLFDGLDVVGGGWLGFSLTDRHDAHVYLLHNGTAAVLVDSGCGLDPGRILDLVAGAGVRPASIRRILLTHCHADHAAGAAALAEATGARVSGSAWTAAVLGRADEQAAGLASARAAGVYPVAVRLTRTTVYVVDDGADVGVPGIPVTAIATPGHARGHLCYLAEIAGRRVLFSGDHVFARGRVAVLATADTDIAALAASMDRVAAARPDALLPGHGAVALTDAGAHVDAAREHLRAGRLPPGLLP